MVTMASSALICLSWKFRVESPTWPREEESRIFISRIFLLSETSVVLGLVDVQSSADEIGAASHKHLMEWHVLRDDDEAAAHV
jgi:hypothetical protein